MAIGARILLRATVDLSSAATGVPTKELLGFASFAPIAAARKLACWSAHRVLHVSLPLIGEHFGGRDHTTILYLVRSHDQLILKDHEVKLRSYALRREMRRWATERKRDPSCQTTAFCDRLRQQNKNEPISHLQEPSGVAWFERDGEKTTMRDFFRSQDEKALAIMRAGLEQEARERAAAKRGKP